MTRPNATREKQWPAANTAPNATAAEVQRYLSVMEQVTNGAVSASSNLVTELSTSAHAAAEGQTFATATELKAAGAQKARVEAGGRRRKREGKRVTAKMSGESVRNGPTGPMNYANAKLGMGNYVENACKT